MVGRKTKECRGRS